MRKLVQAFGKPAGSSDTGPASPAKLSPGTKKIQEDFFEGESAQGKFSDVAFKVYQKKFKSMIQLLGNASEGLDKVHQEMSA